MAYRVLSPETVTIGEGVEIGEGAIIFPNNHLFGCTKIGAGAVLYPNNILEDTTVGDGASVTASVARGAVIGRGAEVGPFANLRPCLLYTSVRGDNGRVLTLPDTAKLLY